ncbi:extracellular solute-binding protein [Paenibacillus thermoaerophilus]|nr:extracellular solute-binding protein [Paenibacillus thermoaerophilus]
MKSPVRPVSCVVMSAFVILLASGCTFHAPAEAEPTEKPDASRISIVINGLELPFPDGMDENHNPYLDYIERETGLDVVVQIPPPDTYEEKLNVIMASGNRPDLINTTNGIWMDNYARQGALLPLDDLLKQYGPNLLKNIPEEAWDRVRYQGKIYAVPSQYETKGMEIVYARKDWLDRLGLRPPVTLDEYYNVIRAFAMDDPDGNGINDTYGLILADHLGRTAPFFGAFGTQLKQWIERDGELVYGSILPETKEALAFLARLYREGLLDPMFPLNHTANLGDKVASGKVGLFSATWYDTRNSIEVNRKRFPSAKWIPLEYPVGPKGHKGVYGTGPVRSYNVIPVGSQNPAGVIRFLDFMAGEGYTNLKLGFENEVWSMKDGVMVTDFAQHNKHQYRGIYQSLVDLYKPDVIKRRLDSLGDFHLYENLTIIEKNLIPNAFKGAPTPAMVKYSDKLQDLEENVFVELILGQRPIDDFEEFVRQWKEQGGDEMTREVNEWYRQSKKGTGH